MALAAIFLTFHQEFSDAIILKKQLLVDVLTVANLKETQPVSILFVGDLMLSRGVAYQIQKNNDLYFPFRYFRNLLQKSDFVFANLESPLINGRKIHAGEMTLRADEKMAPILKEMNFSIVSLANNHLLDFNENGLLNTLKILNENQIQYVGVGENFEEAHQFKILEKNGIKFAFLAYNDSDVVSKSTQAETNKPGTAFMDINALKTDIAEAKKSADYVIVSMHGGNEYQADPNNRQIEFNHTAIDAGANLVIGHHPHVVQKIEKYENGYIFYGLGNFIFDQMWSEATRQGAAIQINFLRDRIKNIKIIPFVIENYSQPRIIYSQTDAIAFKQIVDALQIPVDKIFNVENKVNLSCPCHQF